MEKIIALNKAIQEVIDQFAEKQGIDFQYAVGDDLLGALCFDNDEHYLLQDIVYDLGTHQPPRKIYEWLLYLLEINEYINYRSYCMGWRKEENIQKNK